MFLYYNSEQVVQLALVASLAFRIDPMNDSNDSISVHIVHRNGYLDIEDIVVCADSHSLLFFLCFFFLRCALFPLRCSAAALHRAFFFPLSIVHFPEQQESSSEHFLPPFLHRSHLELTQLYPWQHVLVVPLFEQSCFFSPQARAVEGSVEGTLDGSDVEGAVVGVLLGEEVGALVDKMEGVGVGGASFSRLNPAGAEVGGAQLFPQGYLQTRYSE
jgi:hypothetical protein